MNWKDYVEHVYCICSDEENKDNIAELERVKLYNTDIFSFFYYTLDKPFTAYKYFRDAAVIEAICDANKKGYSSIMIIRDELQFLDSIDAIETEIKKCDKYIYNILNTGDISEDCVIIRKPIIDYIANINIEVTNYNYFNDEHSVSAVSEYFTCTNWQNIIIDYINENFKINKVNIAQHKIDYVISYVDSSDVNWQEDFKKSKVTNKLVNGSQRWRDWGFFEYNIQCLNTYLQWLNNIYIIVSGTTQIPEWASKYPNVKWVLHSDYIDTSYLPTFNSCAIESFLFNIPNLSEYFIYSNDDVFCIDNLRKKDFFENGKLKFATTNLGQKTSNHISICKNSFKLLLGEFSQSYFSEIKIDNYFKRLTHTPHPMLKSVGKHLYALNKKAIDKSITKFRTDTNINQYIYPLYNYLTNEYIEYELPMGFTQIQEIDKIKDAFKQTKIICINDNAEKYANADELKSTIIALFESKVKLPEQKEIPLSTPIKVDNNIIDFVFPYVDSKDPEWIKEYNKYCPKDKTKWNDWAAGPERFRGNDLLKYMFRSVAQNMPWVNKIHMLVMSDTQVPKWVNRENVNIVYHKDFIPANQLPTFNSTCIEMFLPNIKDLPENFIYSNDDVYITQTLPITAFFKDNIPCYSLTERQLKENAPGDPIRKNSLDVIYPQGKNNTIVYDTQHLTISYKKSSLKKCFDTHKTEILNSCSKFRDEKNFNQYIYAYNQFINEKIYNVAISPRICTFIDEQHKRFWDRDLTQYKMCCLNDSNKSTEDDLKAIDKKLKQLFPKKCKYEL